MAGNETRATCRAQLALTGAANGRDATTYDCILDEGHAGLHQDGDTDRWGINYPEPVTGLGSLEISDLSRRVTALEAAWTVGGETLSERLDRVVPGVMEQIRAVTADVHLERKP